jgi:myosin heavy subunit
MLSDVKQSLKILPYSDAEECVWRVVAAILHLGNVSFKETPGGKCEVTNLESLKHVCRLL